MATKKATKKTVKKTDAASKTAAPAPAPQVKLSHKIWDKIKDVDLELFALPDQFVEVNATPVFDISDEELHLLLKAEAVLPQLEEKLRAVRWDRKDPSKRLEVYQKSKFVVVKVATAD